MYFKYNTFSTSCWWQIYQEYCNNLLYTTWVFGKKCKHYSLAYFTPLLIPVKSKLALSAAPEGGALHGRGGTLTGITTTVVHLVSVFTICVTPATETCQGLSHNNIPQRFY